ncbi:MAG: glycosyltransferase family 4 protein [Planctomycetota bacterium]|nr:glycosyltransferase family 4 protein [Planctomycetota bacterium]
MHLLFLTDNFPPETNAPATRGHEHARRWVQAGHRVTVITCAPNFPEGKVHAGYQNRWHQREVIDGIEVVRVKSFIAANKGFAARILDYVSFMVTGSTAGLFVDRPDVVLATSPQFFCAVGGWAVAKLRRRPFVFEVRDLWPESIKAVGAMRQSLLIEALEKLELFLYRQANGVVVATEAFRDNLRSRGIDPRKITVVRNGVDLTRYAPRERDAELAKELGLTGKFVVGYLGTHGMAHALHRVVEAAELVRADPRIHFLFVGGGAERDSLVELARSKGLTNVSFHASFPKETMPRLWSVCDLGLVHLKDQDVFRTVIPSKIFECFGMGVPVLYAGPESEGSQIVREARGGVTLPAENPQELAEAVRSLAADPERVRELATSARAAAPRYDRERNALAMLDTLVRLAPEGPTPASVRERTAE